MDEKLEQAVTAMEERFAARRDIFRDQVSLMIAPDRVIEAARTLRDEFGFNMLSDETAVDYWPQEEPRFHVIYVLRRMQPPYLLLMLRAPLNGNAPRIATMEKVFPNANWLEREIWDMFGIYFDGHSDMRRILMPYDWEGHPLRKDYPLGYEEVQFTFNFDEIDKRKSRPKE
mgnify:CR=1 FL=1